MTNPDPAHITAAMWRLWLFCAGVILGVRLGGIYAAKPFYHNTVNANKKSWPGNYSIVLPLDLTQPDDKARAIDLTMSTAEMIRRTGYLKAAAEHPDDNRLYALREFIGTVDGVTVLRMSKDTIEGPWFYSTSDASHLWHDHLSVFTEFCDDLEAMAAIASVLSGQSWEDWVVRGGSIMPVMEASNAFQGDIDAWRLDALTYGLEHVRGGPLKGEPMWVVQQLKKIEKSLAATSSVPVTVDAAAVAAALLANPAFVAALDTAAFKGAQQAERE